MRRFRLMRAEDVSGVSGTGNVAEGVSFSDGRIVISWSGPYRSISIFESLGDLEAIHGHGGRTWIDWLDPPAESADADRRAP